MNQTLVFSCWIIIALLEFLVRDCPRLCGISNKSGIFPVNVSGTSVNMTNKNSHSISSELSEGWILGVVEEYGKLLKRGKNKNTLTPFSLFLYVFGILHDKKVVCVCLMPHTCK